MFPTSARFIPAQAMGKGVWFLAVFLFVFGWRLRAELDLTNIVALFAVMWAFFWSDSAFSPLMLRWLCLFAVTASYAVFIAATHGAYDLLPVLRLLRAMVTVLGGIALASVATHLFGSLYLLRCCQTLFICIVSHAIIILLMYLNAPIRLFILELTGVLQYVNNPLSIELGLRVPGLTYGLGTTSVLQGMGLLLLPALWERYSHVVPRLLLSLSVVLILASMALSGRSGFVIILPLCLLWFWLAFCRQRFIRSSPPAIFIGLFGLAILLPVTNFFGMASFELDLENLAFTLRHLSELLVLLETGQSDTTVFLSDHIFFPEDFGTLVFGSGNSGRGAGPYIPSDLGFVLGVFSYGIVGSILYLKSYLFPFVAMWKRIDIENAIMFGAVLIFFAVMLMHMKQVAIFTRQLWSVQSLLAAALLIRFEL